MEQPFVSIILPTYNVVKYLEQCLNSIKDQTYQNYEVIIVIDGATDGSYDLAKNYCVKNDKFTVYWQENAGSGPARNTGLDHAKANYCMFVDPDDWLEPDCLEKLMEAQQEGDYDLTVSYKIKCKFDQNDKLISRSKCYGRDFAIIGQDKCRQYYLEIYENHLVSAPTRKIYKMALIKNNHVEFPAYRRSQDIVFNYRYFDCVKSVRSINYCGYNYRTSMANNIGKVRKEYIDTVITIYNDIKTLHEKWGVKCNLSQLASNVFLNYLNIYLQVASYYGYEIQNVLNNVTVKEIVKEAKPDRFYLKIARFFLVTKLNKLALWLMKSAYMAKLKYLR